MLQSFFRGLQNQPALIPLVIFAVLIVILIVVRMVRASQRWTPEEKVFYALLAKHQQRQARFKLALYGMLALIMLVIYALARRPH